MALIALCPICLVNPQPLLRITSHPTNPLTRNIVFPCYSAPLKKKAEQVLESIEGFSIADEQKARIKIVREHYDFIEKLIAKVDTCVNEMVAKYGDEINLLCTIPVLTAILLSPSSLRSAPISASLVLPSGFAAGWIDPGNNESAGKKKSVRISRAGVYL